MEIFLDLAITILILKEQLVDKVSDFQSFLKIYQRECLEIELELFSQLYREAFSTLPFYQRSLRQSGESPPPEQPQNQMDHLVE